MEFIGYWIVLSIGIFIGMCLNAIFTVNKSDENDDLRLPRKL